MWHNSVNNDPIYYIDVTPLDKLCMSNLENYFAPFRDGIIGYNLSQDFNGESRRVIYADWTASGRLYQPIEDYMQNQIGPYVANTHTEATLTGCTMTNAYHDAQKVIKQHVNAGENDVLITGGSGMTSVINKFQRILGLRLPEPFSEQVTVAEQDKPVVFITHMEHHSNQTTWNTCEVTVQMIKPNQHGMPDLDHLRELLNKYADRATKIGAFTACSNVTGIITPYHEMAEIMHQHGGLCFVDFACSAPYVSIDMHPANPAQKLDAVYFSPHKFLGGPGSSGILVFDKKLYQNKIPDQPGGGTVTWTNPWGQQGFFDDIEAREDGGTPGFLQLIRVALAMKVKDAMGVENIQAREHELLDLFMSEIADNDDIMVLEDKNQERLCIISLFVPGIHHNLIVRLLNDRFGIQTRGGCSCAGTYGHILFGVDENSSKEITDKIDSGDLTDKPGWVRISFHPTTTNQDVLTVVDALKQVIANAKEWSSDYRFLPSSGDFEKKSNKSEFISINSFNPRSYQSANTKSRFKWFNRSA
ncbi:MAG: aminotransferase class V-fold PLP-dependent enzyme [Kangiellaceae bacterium]|jgi:selenocysteine lyase/cysteine desulfurase|nr:aminotransferase class V-fold PLP-dependent enzyme [Kangiellaceae bacterium]